VLTGRDTDVLVGIDLDRGRIVVRTPRFGVDLERRLADALQRDLAAVDGVDTSPGRRDVSVRDAEMLQDRLEGGMNLAGLGIADVVTVDEDERIVLALDVNEVRRELRIHPAPLSSRLEVRVDVFTGPFRSPLVAGVVPTLGTGRRVVVIAVGALDRRVGVGPRRVRGLRLLARHPRVTLDLRRCPDTTLGDTEVGPGPLVDRGRLRFGDLRPGFLGLKCGGSVSRTRFLVGTIGTIE